MKIIGISAFYHDSAAVLINNDEIVSAVQEERFSRIKHDSSFPMKSIEYILKSNNLKVSDVDAFVFYEKPFLKFERLLETYLNFAPIGIKSFLKFLPTWIKQKLFIKKYIYDEINKIEKTKNLFKKIFFSEHHMSHAASAFYPSNFKNAVILTLDGVGEWTTSSVCVGKDNKIKKHKEIHFPDSLGLLYSAFTYYCGFKVNSGEYKLMGLAPYGEPEFKEKIYNNLINIKDDGSFKLNLKYFSYTHELKMINKKFEKLFGHKSRNSTNEKLTQFHMNIARSIQEVLNDIIIKIILNLKKEFPYIENLCMAGGVALNSVTNEKIQNKEIFKNIWIQPAAGDAGGALGAALSYKFNYLNQKRIIKTEDFDNMKGSFLGPSFTSNDIKSFLKSKNINFKELKKDELANEVAQNLNKNKIIGLFQGKMEFGPRALGGRSIIADPRSPDMQKNCNLKIKFRESFRPFAPAILEEDSKEWFKKKEKSPYMLFVTEILDKHKINHKKKEIYGLDKINFPWSNLPAITHVDYSCRLQTVSKDTNPVFYEILKKFKSLTDVPILLNTSFNIRGEPIVCSIEDSFKCFMGTDLDLLVLENFLIYKKDNASHVEKDYKNKFQLD